MGLVALEPCFDEIIGWEKGGGVNEESPDRSIVKAFF